MIGLVGSILFAAARAEAAANHSVAGPIKKVGAGWHVTLRLNPVGGSNRVTVGVALGRTTRSAAMTHTFATSLTLSGPSEQTFEIPADGRFKSGGQVTFLSQWNKNGSGTHYWGNYDTHTLP